MKRKGIGNHEPGADGAPASAARPNRGFNAALESSDSRFQVADPSIVVRHASSSDLPAILSLRMALLREHSHNAIYARLRPDAESRASKLFAAQLQSLNEVIFLADMGSETVGILRCIHSTGSPLLEPAQYAYVSSVYVVPKARERGVLRALLSAADAWCEARGLDEMRLHNAADNPLANAAWEALGFDVVEHLRVRSLRKR